MNLHSSPPSAPGPHSSLLRPAPRCTSPRGSWGLHDRSLDGTAGRLPGRGRPVALTPQRSHFSDSAPRGDVDRSETQLAQLTGARWTPPGPPRKDVTKAGPIGCRWHARPRAVGVVCLGHACFRSCLLTWSRLGHAELFGAELTEVRNPGTCRLMSVSRAFPRSWGEEGSDQVSADVLGRLLVRTGQLSKAS